jgi:hypothetical protein
LAADERPAGGRGAGASLRVTRVGSAGGLISWVALHALGVVTDSLAGEVAAVGVIVAGGAFVLGVAFGEGGLSAVGAAAAGDALIVFTERAIGVTATVRVSGALDALV